jgi:ribonuclease-3
MLTPSRIGVAPLLQFDHDFRVEKSKDSVLSDALEALFAAVRLDAGHEARRPYRAPHGYPA